MPAKERRNTDNDILIGIVELKKDTEYLRERIDKINGCLNDYSVQKEKIKISAEKLAIIEPIVTNLRIKIYGIGAIIGLVSGLIGTLIGKFLG